MCPPRLRPGLWSVWSPSSAPNAHLHAIPKHATAKEYARATGLECLFGHLFLEGKTERINWLFVTVMEELYGI